MNKSVPKSAPGRAFDEEDRKSPPLSVAEKAAVKRAEADVKAGRLHEHDSVAKWLRQRATKIVKGKRKSG